MITTLCISFRQRLTQSKFVNMFVLNLAISAKSIQLNKTKFVILSQPSRVISIIAIIPEMFIFFAEMESSERLVSEQDEPVLCDETMCQFDLEEAKGILASLSLTYVTFEDYLIVLRSEFDVSILGQPYLALMLLFNVNSGKY